MKVSPVLELAHAAGNERNSEGAFIDLADGRILFAYSRFTTGSDFGDGSIACRCSSDRGLSWDAADRIIVPNAHVTTMSVSLVRASRHRIALFYLIKADLVSCRPCVRFSDDEGDTWSEPTMIAPASGYYVLNNDRVLQYHDGRLLVATGYHRRIGETTCSSRAIAIIFYSDDQGQTWQESDNWVLPPQFSHTGLHEPGLVQLMDRRIMGWARTDTGCQWVFFSSDRGESWSEARPATEFLSPTSPLTIKRNPHDPARLYAAWNDHAPRYSLPDCEPASWRRTPLVLAVSDDDARTWQGHRVIESAPDHGYCYIAMHFLSAHALLLAYCCGSSDGAPGNGVLNDLRITRVELA
jgi:hypothetical protein